MPKSKYETHVAPYLDKIAVWARQGCTDKAIAENLHISYSSYHRYRTLGEEGDTRYADFFRTLMQAKPVPDDEVENSLFRRCTGYIAAIAKTFKLKVTEYDPDTGRKVSESEKLEVGYDEVHVPPDLNAQLFWLTNRRPEQWRRDTGKQSAADESDTGGVIVLPAVAEEPEEEE